MLAHHESGDLAAKLIEQSCAKQGVDREQLVIHADRGSAPKSETVAQMLADLGVERSHSRPHVSNDNPFSEAQFKTLKCQPDYPKEFGSYEHGLSYCRAFFPWYNHEHRHAGIAMLTRSSTTAAPTSCSQCASVSSTLPANASSIAPTPRTPSALFAADPSIQARRSRRGSTSR